MNLKQSIEEIIKQPDYEPMSVSDFQDALGLNSADSFRDLIKVLVELEQTGLIERTKTDRYQRKESSKSNSKLIKGTLSQKRIRFFDQKMMKWKMSSFLQLLTERQMAIQ